MKQDIEYPSLVDPPAGYALLRSEAFNPVERCTTPQALQLAEECGLDPEEPLKWDDYILFRAIVQHPDGRIAYAVMSLDSKIPLCKKAFWEDFWQQVVKCEKPRRRRNK